MAYIDGFVLAVPTASREAYRALAEMSAAVLKEHGALRVVEAWGDDVPMGEHTSFPRAVQCKDDETVVFSWIVWPSRAARDEGGTKFMEDPRIKAAMADTPFDGKRMIYGGFEIMLEA